MFVMYLPITNKRYRGFRRTIGAINIVMKMVTGSIRTSELAIWSLENPLSCILSIQSPPSRTQEWLPQNNVRDSIRVRIGLMRLVNRIIFCNTKFTRYAC